MSASRGNPNIAPEMRSWRKRLGIKTAREAGELLGISKRTIEGIEQGKSFSMPLLLGLAMKQIESDLADRI